MLVLSRKESQRIRLGDSIVITVVRVSGDKVRLGIEAPRDMVVLRDELKPLNPALLKTDQPKADGLVVNGLEVNGPKANGLEADQPKADGPEKWGRDSETLGKSIEMQVGPSPVIPPLVSPSLTGSSLTGSSLTGSPLAKDLLNTDAHCDTATVA
jgi:carbon storage regulator